MTQPLTIYSSRTADKFVLRLPDGMRERICEVARNQHRSMNSEIISRLEASLIHASAVQYADGDATQLSPQEWRLVESFRSLAPHQRNALIEIISIKSANDPNVGDAHE